MPELPEVETFKRYFDSTSLNKKINEISVRDNRVLNVEENNLKKKIIGKTFNSSQRHGKYLVVDLNSIFLVFHFGMTGDFEYFSKLDEEPTHSRILFEFQNSDYLSYISQRMFGKVDLTEKVERFIREKNLGPDAFNMTFKDFKSTLKKRSAYAKSALMDQSIIAGIGNIYSDEVLYQAKIHPKTKINKLDELKLKELFDIIKSVLECGIEKTSQCTGLTLNLALSYGGRLEIVDAVKAISQKVKASEIDLDQLDEELFSNYLYTKELSDPDLLIRTSGELRISNFLLWQMAYTEMYITDVLWPDFRRKHLYEAIRSFQKRERRFGKVSDQLKSVNN